MSKLSYSRPLPKHVSIFLPRETPFYRGLLPQIRRGFEACGVETSGACRHLEASEMREFCEAKKPDLIFEMNRPRRDALFIPPHIKHAVWVVDFNGRDIEYFSGSELTYYFGTPWKRHGFHKGLSRWMGPGTCPDTYYPAESFPKNQHQYVASFIGHIPRPWSEEELNRQVSMSDMPYTFADLLEEFEPFLRRVRDNIRRRGRKRHKKWGRIRGDAVYIANRICRDRTRAPLRIDPVLRYDITGRVIRHLSRCDLLNNVLGRAKDRLLKSGVLNDDNEFLAIYGPENWKEWKPYAPYYRGFLSTPDQMREAFQKSLIQLHEGTGIHFRSMDAMASGALLYFRRSPHDRMASGISSLFEENHHFVPFTPEELPSRLERYTKDLAAAQEMRRAGRAAVLRAHTWKHRAAEILQDLGDLPE